MTTNQTDGQTYALVFIQNPGNWDVNEYTTEDNALRMNEFAASLGGSLVVYSSDDERAGPIVAKQSILEQVGKRICGQLLDYAVTLSRCVSL